MIYILGAGSMGCLWAAYLYQAYPDKIRFLTTRSSKQAHLHFELETVFEDKPSIELNIPVVSIVDVSDIDTLLVCTKSYGALPAIKALKDKLSDHSDVVLFQNGLGSQFEVLNLLKDIPLYAAVTTEGANRQSVNKVIHAGSGQTFIGALNSPAKENKKLIDLFSKLALDVIPEKDIWSRLWIKLAINCAINPFTALLNCPNGEIKSAELFQDKWPGLLKELTSMLEAAGYPIGKTELENAVFDVMQKTGKNISSMLQDIRNHKRTEIDDINGFAQRFLKEKQRNFATNEHLWNAVNELTADTL